MASGISSTTGSGSCLPPQASGLPRTPKPCLIPKSLICDEPALIDIVSQDAIQYVHMSERGGTIKVGVKHIESLKPEYQRINVAYQIFDIVLHEGDQFQR